MVGSADKVNWLIGYLGKWWIKWWDFSTHGLVLMAHHSSCTSNLHRALTNLQKLELPVVTL